MEKIKEHLMKNSMNTYYKMYVSVHCIESSDMHIQSMSIMLIDEIEKNKFHKKMKILKPHG